MPHEAPAKRFGETVLPFKDPDGLPMALVATVGAEADPAWSDGEVPASHAVRGLHGVGLLLEEAAPTAAILADVLGFAEMGREGSLVRFEAPGARKGGVVDLHVAGGFLPGRMGAGSVHHIAFWAASDAMQAEMAEKLA